MTEKQDESNADQVSEQEETRNKEKKREVTQYIPALIQHAGTHSNLGFMYYSCAVGFKEKNHSQH